VKGSYISVKAIVNILNVINVSLCSYEKKYYIAYISSGSLKWLQGKGRKKGKSPYS